MKKYSVVLALGSGIDEQGIIPESAKSKVKKAVELYDSKVAKNIVFSGKFSHTLEFTPPITEALAMKNYALELGVDKDRVFTEDESYSTVSNICLVKEKFLIPNDWTSVMLVVVYPLAKRNEYNLKMVLGPKYEYKLIAADFKYPREVEEKLEKIEKDKYKDCVAFYKNITEGDHKMIKVLSDKDLEVNYKGGQK